jgi:hypothetical protein
MKKYLLPLLILFSLLANGATYYSIGNGSPSTSANWGLTRAGGTQPSPLALTNGANDFVIQPGYTMTATASTFTPQNLTIESGGSLIMGGFTLNFPSPASILTLGGILDISGTISQTTIIINNLGGAGELRVGSTTWTGLATATGTFFTNYTNTVTFFGTTALTIPARAYPTLRIEGTGTKTIGGNILVNKDFLIIGGTANIPNNRTLSINGDFQNSGTLAGTGTVAFTGTGVQKLTGATSFSGLTVNNVGGSVVLGTSSPISVSNALALTAGRLQIGSNNLTYTGAGTGLTTVSGWVETNGTGYFSIPQTGTFTFPVGDATNPQFLKRTNPANTNNFVRFGTSSSTLPSLNTGSWFVTSGTASFSGLSLLSPIGSHQTTSKIAYKQTADWNPVATGFTSPNYNTSLSIPTSGVTEIALYSCTVPTITGPNSVIIGNNITLIGTGTPRSAPWTSSLPGVATIDPTTGVVTGNGAGNTVITYTDNFGCSSTTTITVPPPTQPLGNRGMYFDGVDDKVIVPHNASSSFGGASLFTYEVWVKTKQLGSTQTIIGKRTSSNEMEIALLVNPSGSVSFGTAKQSVAWSFLETSTSVIEANKWVHLAFVKDAVGNSKKIYVNGVLQTTTGGTDANYLTAVAPSSSSLQIGDSDNGGSTFGFFNGQLDEVKIYNIARTASQIQVDMGSTSTTDAGLVAYWNFEDDASGVNASTVTDLVSGTIGTPNKGALWALRTTKTTDLATDQGSLRWAIAEANNDTDTDYIDFSIQQADANVVSVIQPTSTITINESVYLDGYSAYGSSPNTATFLNQNNAQLKTELNFTTIPEGVVLNSSNSIMRGLSIHSANDYNVRISGSANIFCGNYVGITALSTKGIYNSKGISLEGSGGHTLGYVTAVVPADFNVISNSNYYAVEVNAGNNTIQGNYLGTDPSGNQAWNGVHGLFFQTGIGSLAKGNLISGCNNNEWNVRMDGGPNTLIGNYIGIKANLSGACGTAGGVVAYNFSSQNIIGGDLVGEPNIIAYAAQGGIDLRTYNQVVRRNSIYCNGTGNTASGILDSPVLKPTLSGSISGTTVTLNVGNMDVIGPKDIYFYKNTSCGANQGETFVAKATTVSGVNTYTYSGTAFAVGDVVTVMYVSSNGSSVFSDVLSLCDNPLLVTLATDNNPLGGGQCGDLRYAISYSEANPAISPAKNQIDIKIATAAPYVIKLNAALPKIAQNVTINGRNQTGYQDVTNKNDDSLLPDYKLAVEIDGQNNYDYGLQVTAGNFKLRGVSIGGFKTAGILAKGTNLDTLAIEGCYIGLHPDGTPNPNGIGVDIDLAGVSKPSMRYVGGGSRYDCNFIAGNTSDGIRISNASDFYVIKNIIGLKPDGTTPIPNGGFGVNIVGSTNVSVGYDGFGLGNVISGNSSGQVSVSSSTGTQFYKNRIGVAFDGATAVNNPNSGITFSDSKSSIIGSEVFPNTIAYNTDYGILMDGTSSTSNKIISNSIYANKAGGIKIASGVQENIQQPVILLAVINPDNSASVTLQEPATSPIIDSVSLYLDATDQGQYYLGKYLKNISNTYTILATDLSTAKSKITGTAYMTAIQKSTGKSSSAFSAPVALTTCNPLIVTSTADNGTCGTLRNAITAANTIIGQDTIKFKITGGSLPYTINLLSQLPDLTDNSGTVINGFSQPGSSANTRPVFNATATTPMNAVYGIVLGNAANIPVGLNIVAGSKNNVIKGLVLQDFADNVLSIDDIAINIDGNNNQVLGCIIGVDATGLIAGTKTGIGIKITGNNNIIGDGTPAGANLISGFKTPDICILIVGTATAANTISGNMIGLLKDGVTKTTAMTNSLGIALAAGANSVSGNVISGRGYGITIDGNWTSTANQIKGNIIGLQANGVSHVVGNIQNYGVYITDFGNTIGGSTVAERNIISGNENSGIYLIGAGCSTNVVKGNYIGLDKTGTTFVAGSTQDYGVYITSSASGNTIGGDALANEGNVISGNSSTGIYATSTNANTIVGNHIGTQANGVSLLVGNAQTFGILLLGQGHVVGGNSPANRNIISGNSVGISINSPTSSNNSIKGNYIGLDVTGSVPVAQQTGISILASGGSIAIGGANAGEGNVISGNTSTGINITNSITQPVTIEGNIIGLQKDGISLVVPNQQPTGVTVQSAVKNVVIGGSSVGQRNIISGNTLYGLTLSASSNVVKGNYIGSSSTALIVSGSTQKYGVYFQSPASNNIIGSAAVGEGNYISFNTTNGIFANGIASINNKFSGNSIFSNTAKGININYGATAANGGKVVPVISSATPSLVSGTGTNGDSIEIFSNTPIVANQKVQGKTYLKSAKVVGTTWSITGTFTLGDSITATATDATNGTSEFSAAKVVAAPITPVTITDFNPKSGTAGTTVTIIGTGFSTIAKDNRIWFGGMPATVTGTPTTTSLQVTVPFGATYSTISVENKGFTAESKDWFNVSLACTLVQSFKPTAANPAVGANELAVITADFDKDGNADIATTGENAMLSLLLGNGDGSFKSSIDLSLGATASSLANADFNADGIQDLAVGKSNIITILTGDGSGNFTPKDFTSGGTSYGITVHDFNADGFLDIASANYDSDFMSILLGNGDGTFQKNTDYVSGAVPYGIDAGYLDADGILDLVVVNNVDNKVAVFIGNGDGTFKTKTEYNTGKSPNAVVARDFDKDGDLDLVTTNNDDGQVGILMNNGSGIFGASIPYATAKSPSGLAVSELNGDGFLDLVVGCISDDSVSVLYGKSSGTFGKKVNFKVGKSPYSVAVADFDNNGNPDLVSANFNDSYLSVLLSKCSASIPGAALDFDGVKDYVTTNLWTTALKNITLEAVVLWKGSTGANQNILLNGDSGDKGYGIAIYGDSGGDVLTILVGGVAWVSTGVVMTQNVWHHIVAVNDNGAWFLYLDGTPMALTNNTAIPRPIVGVTNSYIGTEQAIQEKFYGTIDEVRIWSRPLCEAEIQNNMNCEKLSNQNGLIARYDFNGGNAGGNNSTITTAIDSSGNTNYGTLSGFNLNGSTSNWVAPGKITPGSACIPVVQPVGTTWTWTGAVSKDWFSPCNWDMLSVPIATSIVDIPAFTPYQPEIAGSGNVAKCLEIRIDSKNGANVNLRSDTGATLKIK